MDDMDKLRPQPAASPEPPRAERKPRRAGLFIVLTALVAAVAGGVVTNAFGHDVGRMWGGDGWGMHSGWGMDRGMGRGGWGMMGMDRGMDDPAAMAQHVERMVKHMAVEVDATPEQEAKLAAIAKAAAEDLLPLRQQFRGAGKDVMALLAGPTVDRAAIEQFRAAKLQLADTASKRLTQALADAAEVLTPAQRQQLAQLFGRMHERHGHGWQLEGDQPGQGGPGRGGPGQGGPGQGGQPVEPGQPG